jgi:hypothetical protein
MGNWKAELSRFMKILYPQELAKERQAVSEYILDPTRIGSNLGQNLIADVLAQDAAYTKFNPYPTKAINAGADSALHDAETNVFSVPAGYEVKDVMGAGVPISLDEQATVMLKVPDEQELLPVETQTTLWSRNEDHTAPTVAEGIRPSSQALLQSPPPPAVDPSSQTMPLGGGFGESEIPTMPRVSLDDDPTDQKVRDRFVEAETTVAPSQVEENRPQPLASPPLIDDLDEMSTQITEFSPQPADHSEDDTER